jgi:hypothetical protein
LELHISPGPHVDSSTQPRKQAFSKLQLHGGTSQIAAAPIAAHAVSFWQPSPA